MAGGQKSGLWGRLLSVLRGPASDKSSLEDAVVRAIEEEDFAALAKLEDDGADILDASETGNRLLSCLRPDRYGKFKPVSARLVEYLLELGVDIQTSDAQGKTASLFAVEAGRPELLELLVNRGANVLTQDRRGWSPLYASVTCGSQGLDCARLLLKQGADPDENLPVGRSARQLVEQHLQHDSKFAPLFMDLFNDPELAKISKKASLSLRGSIHHIDSADGLSPSLVEKETYIEIWNASVPPQGQSRTIEGELLRSVERLRSEAMRNGNMNWENGYAYFLEVLNSNLRGDPAFDTEARAKIDDHLDQLANYEQPCHDPLVFDYLCDRVAEVFRHHGSRQRDLEPGVKI